MKSHSSICVCQDCLVSNFNHTTSKVKKAKIAETAIALCRAKELNLPKTITNILTHRQGASLSEINNLVKKASKLF